MRGFALGVFRAGELVRRALSKMTGLGIAVDIADAAARPGDRQLYVSPGGDSGRARWPRYTGKVDVAGRTWTVTCTPTDPNAARLGAMAWLVLFGALGLTGMLALYLSARGRAERQLRRAHAELSDLNEQLAKKSEELAANLQSLQATRAQLVQEEKLKSVGRLAAGIAHEINTPIQFVIDSVYFLGDSLKALIALITRYQQAHRAWAAGSGFEIVRADLARSQQEADLDYLLENLPAAVDRSMDGLQRVATIVQSMKEFAHPDQREMTTVDLNHALQSTLTIARSEYKYVAEVEADFGDVPPVRCYAGELNQVFLNILVNAAHAIESVVGDAGTKGTIRVRTRRDGDMAVISIGDTGGGIPDAIRDRIYDPFFTTKEVGKGTGQGLAIARSVVVEKHGGELSFVSEPGQGTTFTIRLPIEGRGRKPA